MQAMENSNQHPAAAENLKRRLLLCDHAHALQAQSIPNMSKEQVLLHARPVSEETTFPLKLQVAMAQKWASEAFAARDVDAFVKHWFPFEVGPCVHDFQIEEPTLLSARSAILDMEVGSVLEDAETKALMEAKAATSRKASC